MRFVLIINIYYLEKHITFNIKDSIHYRLLKISPLASDLVTHQPKERMTSIEAHLDFN